MAEYAEGLSSLGTTRLRIVLLVALAIGAVYRSAFVVSTGAGLAGNAPIGDFVALATSLLVVAVTPAEGSPRA